MPAEPLPHDDVRPSPETLAPGAPVATCIFLHGFPLDRRMWRGQLERLARASVRAIAVDLRGFGAARRLERATSIESMAADVAATIRALGLDRPIVVGLSMGGYVALALAHLAERAPALLGGLVLADTRASADSAAALEGRAANVTRARAAGDAGAAAVFEAMIPSVFAAETRVAHPARVEAFRAIAAEQSTEAVVAALEAMRDRPDATPWLSAVAVPTTVIVGAHDALTPPSVAESMAQAIAGARLIVVPDAGHFPNVENADAFDAAILGALGR
jgi:pimeloyl-ACP methyl ester carboxylesterase